MEADTYRIIAINKNKITLINANKQLIEMKLGTLPDGYSYSRVRLNGKDPLYELNEIGKDELSIPLRYPVEAILIPKEFTNICEKDFIIITELENKR